MLWGPLVGRGREDTDPFICLWLLKLLSSPYLSSLSSTTKSFFKIQMYGLLLKLTLIELCASPSNILPRNRRLSLLVDIGPTLHYFLWCFMLYILQTVERSSAYSPPPPSLSLSLSLSLCVCVWGRIVCGSIWVLQVRVHNYLVDSLRLLYN
jgi:hypothetical protein